MQSELILDNLILKQLQGIESKNCGIPTRNNSAFSVDPLGYKLTLSSNFCKIVPNGQYGGNMPTYYISS